MIEQLKTIRAGLAIALEAECFVDKPVRRALLDAVKAAIQLEAMAESVEPVAWMGIPVMPGRYKEAVFCSDKNLARQWDYSGHTGLGRLIVTPLYAAPPAQQYEAGDMASAAAQGFRDGVASVAQQPQADTPQATTIAEAARDVGKWLNERPNREIDLRHVAMLVGYVQQALEENEQLKAQQAQPYDQTALDLCDVCGWKTLIPGDGCLNCERKQPQAEAVQYTRADLDRAYSAGLVEGERMAIQQAESVPSDVVRDAAPIPDHELVTMYDERPTSDLEMIEFAREVERRHGIGVQPKHITDGSPCWCNPDVAYADPETGASVIVHRRPQ